MIDLESIYKKWGNQNKYCNENHFYFEILTNASKHCLKKKNQNKYCNKNHLYFEILTNAHAPQTVSIFNLTIWEKE